ncbi:MAG: hypothetical protein EOO48_06120, partial [Flavobacterium sp.]
MSSFTLSLEFTLDGLGAASGLAVVGEKLFFVSDNSNNLYQCNFDGSELKGINLSGDGSQNIPKKLKPDFEALACHANKLYIFGSGSTENRNTLAIVDYASNDIKRVDLNGLYSQMKATAATGYDDFNIEGAVFHEKWYFFQRGNGAANKNGIFTVDDIFK